jgi:hypothetical protein
LFIFAEGFFLFIMFSTAIMTNLASFVKNSFLTDRFNQTEHFKKLVWQKSFFVDVNDENE